MRVALVTDWIYGGGGERVVEEIHKLYPTAPIYTSYCSGGWQKRLDGVVVTGYLQRTPFRQLRKFLPLLRQWWFARLDLSRFDLVISITGNGEAKFVGVPNGTHVSYCHSPVHFYWRKYDEYLKNPGFGIFNPLARIGLRLLVRPLRKRDYNAAQKVDYFIANSSHIKQEIEKSYGRKAVVVHPPVDVARFSVKHSRQRMGFIVAGRQTPYKRFDIAVKACSQLNLPLTVIGQGPEHKKLRKLAGKSVKFVTDADDQELVRLFQSAEAFIFPQEDDFGIVAVEAMAAGTPVIAYKSGGALDYVVPGKSGVFFNEQTPESLANVLQSYDPSRFSHETIQKVANHFSESAFHTKMQNLLNKLADK